MLSLSVIQVPVVSSQDYGKDEDSAEALLKRHEGLMADLDAYGNTIDALHDQAQACKVCDACVIQSCLQSAEFLWDAIEPTCYWDRPSMPYLFDIPLN